MTIFLREDTASQEIILGRFVDSADGNTEETSLTIANTDIKIWKSGATTLADKNSGGATHIANGVYYCVLDATDTSTIGPLEIHVHVAGALYVKQTCVVLDEAVYDSLFGTAALITAGTGTGQLSVSSGQVLLQTGTGTGQLDFASGIVKANVTQFGGTNATTSGGRPEVNTTHAAGTAWGSGAITAASIATDAITAAKVASDVTTEIQSGLATAAALATVDDFLDTEIAALTTELAKVPKSDSTVTWNATALASINTQCDTAISDAGLTAAGIADAVWDEAISGHAVSGSTGEALAAAGGAGDPWITSLPGSYTSGQAGYIVGTNLNATVSSRASQTSLDTVDDFLDTEIAAIKAKTDNLPSDPADASDISTSFTTVNTKLDTIDDFLDTEVAAIKAKTDNLPASPAAVGSAMTLSSAYDFAKGTVAVTESYAADGAAPTPVQALMLIQQALTESSISGTTQTVKKVDGSTTAAVLTLNDSSAPTAVTRSS